MDFALNSEQKMLVDTVRRFVGEVLHPLEKRIEADGRLSDETAQSVLDRSRAIGLYALNMPASLGGGGLSVVDRILCEEQFGHTTDILVRRAFGNVYEPLLECRGELVEGGRRPAVAGTRAGALGLTEPGAGSDARGIRTTARRSGEGWVLNGGKHFISDGLWCDFFLVSARTGDNEISMFLVDKGLPGFSIGKDQAMMGIRGTPHVELFFDNVRLEPVALLGGQGQGFKLAMNALNVVRLAQVGARCVGKASHVLALMAGYAADRRQFGQRIGDFQMIQKMLADSVMEVNATRLMVLHAAWMIDAGLDARDWISMVKVQASEMLGRVVDRAVQVFGGMGFCKELPIERYYRDARVSRIYDGTSEIHRTVIAKSLLGKGPVLFEQHR